MKLSEELQWRGLIKDKTFTDVSWLDEPKTFYLGADVGAADSLTIGNLAIFLVARRLLDQGWNTFLLVGGATSLIGDPGGKETEREMVSREQVEQNKTAIKAQVEQLFAGKTFTLVDNYDWFKDITFLDFLRDVGKNYSVTELMQRDFIASRVGEGGSGISYAEFSYSLIQGYDFWHLFKEHQVELQIGGSDQWGNMISGVPLVRKKEGQEVHAFSMPLVIDKSTGKKFGKSEGGAIWLDAKRTSVYQFYQFWLNVDDEGVEDYLKIYTLLSKEEIDTLLADFQQDKAARSAQKRLAYEVTRIVHGNEAADSVQRITAVLFGGAPLETITPSDVDQLKSELPTARLSDGDAILQALVDTGLASSNGEARRLLEQGGIYLNEERVDAGKTLSQADRKVSGSALLRRGKNQFALIDIAAR